MPGQKKTQKFRDLLNSSNLEFLIEAHNGISAKIAEETGFKGLWAGGLAISAQYGVETIMKPAGLKSSRLWNSWLMLPGYQLCWTVILGMEILITLDA